MQIYQWYLGSIVSVCYTMFSSFFFVPQISPSEGGPGALRCDTAGGSHPAALRETGAVGGSGGGCVRAHVPVAVAVRLRARSAQVSRCLMSW